jgi:hypothetical protein
MNIQRRTFLQVLGALGISIAAPSQAVKTIEDFKVVCDQMPAGLKEQGTYALVAFHREWVARRSPFWRVPFKECQRVLNQHGVVEGNHVWVKLPLIQRPNPYLEVEGDPFFLPGGQSMRYAASKIVYAQDGVNFRIVKNRVSGVDQREIVIPKVMHTTQVPTLHPLNHAFGQSAAEFGEILVL